MTLNEKQEFLNFISENNADRNLDIISKAYDFCVHHHGSQLRKSLEPYYYHPVAVAKEAAKIKMDDTTIIVALLHDVLEDTAVTKADLEREFSKEVADLVDGVTKMDKIKFQEKQIMQAENLRKLLLAISKDVRVLIVKLCDRLHNMQTIQYHSEEKQKQIALETLEIYAPLAERIGLQAIKNELQDISFGVMYPDIKAAIQKQIDILKKDFDSDAIVPDIMQELRETLEKNGIHAEILGREKLPFSVWNKIYNKNVSFDELSDIFAFRIIVESKEDCYKALGSIHLSYHAVPGRFVDYISTPKINNYQSLHTTIMGPKKHMIEIQIRTHKMHAEAEYGLAAHWRYKKTMDPSAAKDVAQLKSVWIYRVLKILEENKDDPKELMEVTKTEIKEERIVAFTQTGEMVDLPRGATILDFAFSVNEEFGTHFDKAKVNGETVNIDYIVQNGDKIKIIKAKAVNIKPAWVNHVITGSARQAILRYIKSQNTKIVE